MFVCRSGEWETMRANQLRLHFSAMAYGLGSGLRRFPSYVQKAP